MAPALSSSGAALLLIDVINPFTFHGGAALRRHAIRAAQGIRGLKGRAERAKLPVIYVNDNFGHSYKLTAWSACSTGAASRPEAA